MYTNENRKREAEEKGKMREDQFVKKVETNKSILNDSIEINKSILNDFIEMPIMIYIHTYP